MKGFHVVSQTVPGLVHFVAHAARDAGRADVIALDVALDVVLLVGDFVAQSAHPAQRLVLQHVLRYLAVQI